MAVEKSRALATNDKVPQASGLLNKIEIISWILLRGKISVPEGLFNGSMGVVKAFRWFALRHTTSF